MYRLPLFDHRVIDLVDGPGALAGRILGDMGAEVIKAESPVGDSLRGSPGFAALNVNKYSCRIDAAELPAITMQLANRADVVVATAGSVDAATLRAENHSLIVVLLPTDAGPAACLAAAGAVGLALWDRRRTGLGGLVEVARLLTGAARPHASARMEPVTSREGHGEAPSSPLHLSETPLHIRLPAPTLGEHDKYVVEHLLDIGAGTPS